MSLKLTHQERLLADHVRRAGGELLRFWPGKKSVESGLLKVDRKQDGSVVTSADFASNSVVVSALEEIFPEDGILSEELPPSAALQEKKRIWIIDPLDGTQSFVDGNDDFSVLVALTESGDPTLGLMYFPARNQFAEAKLGAGAWRDGKRLQVSDSKTLRNESVYIRNFKPLRNEPIYPRWLDSGCAFLTLATGDFDGLIIKIVSHREWDLAAPAVVVQESGGKVTDERGRPISFHPGSFAPECGADGKCRYFVASNGITHEELLQLIPEEERL